MGSDRADDVLQGTTLEVYRFLLKKGKPVGTREVQRALQFSSPSLAVYHLSKLEDAGLLKRQDGDYAIDRVILEDSIKISRFVVPRYLFYAIFAVGALIVYLAYFWPSTVTSGFFFAAVVIAVCAVAFCFETVRAQLRGKL
ncbi:ArsR family transcriptional regulator [Candidatus Bathyarchaeota archaeon]|nr:ArsR family transcriptional regulator [Candidatus Bathyarchaeota archaeon]